MPILDLEQPEVTKIANLNISRIEGYDLTTYQRGLYCYCVEALYI